MTMCKLETMIYANEDGVYSVFTLNQDLKNNLPILLRNTRRYAGAK